MNVIAIALCSSCWLGVLGNGEQEPIHERIAFAGPRCSLGADFNEDGVVGIDDLILLLSSWGPCADCRADIDQNGAVDFSDMIFLLSRWGPTEECPECDDGSDNDEDGLEDEADPGCWTNRYDPETYDPERDNEAAATSQCQDGVDNDFDGKVDYPDDPGCGNPQVYTEIEQVVPGEPACSDGVDNDNDGVVDWGFMAGTDAYCSSPFDTSEQDVLYHPDHHAYIRWNDFPDFTVDNITMVYGALALKASNYYPEREDFGTAPLQRGYSHLSETVEDEGRESLPFEDRATVYQVAEAWFQDPVNDEPWALFRIPWGNNMGLYYDYWDRMMDHIADRYDDTRGTGSPRVAFMTLDVERAFHRDGQILDLCFNELVPAEYRNLCLTDPDEFLYQYKVGIAALYDAALTFASSRVHPDTQVSSYTDVVLHTSTVSYNGIGRYDWERWTSDMSLANYILRDYTAETEEEYNERFGHFYDTLDFVSASGYLSKDYPDAYTDSTTERWERAGGYLSNILFRTDANSAWMAPGTFNTVHLWNRYHPSGDAGYHGLRPWMSHALAIFPHFSGNTGGWLFDWDGYHKSHQDGEYWYITDDMQAENRIAIDNMTYGLYRLAPYEEFFSDDATVYHPMNARDLFTNKEPVWRGRILGDRMLVAAHNPYAAPDHVTPFIITDPQDRVIGGVLVHGLNTWIGVCEVNDGCVGDEGGER